LYARLERERRPAPPEPLPFVVTFYYSNRNPAYTASGHPAVAGSLAADPSVPFGTQYYIPELSFIREDCVFTVHDRGSAVKGNIIDVYIPQALRSDPRVNAALRRGRYPVVGYGYDPENHQFDSFQLTP
jgi:3D (Asp-Asp-Asp) domain-containing protein